MEYWKSKETIYAPITDRVNRKVIQEEVKEIEHLVVDGMDVSGSLEPDVRPAGYLGL